MEVILTNRKNYPQTTARAPKQKKKIDQVIRELAMYQTLNSQMDFAARRTDNAISALNAAK
jgi:hypothetical protein